MSEAPAPREPNDAPPFASWPVLYAIVIAALAACVLALLWLTERFR